MLNHPCYHVCTFRSLGFVDVLVAVFFQMLYNDRYQQSCFVVAGSAGNAIYFVLLSPLLKVPCFLYSNVYCTGYMFLFRSISLDGRPFVGTVMLSFDA